MDINYLNQAKIHDPNYYKYLLSNNYERAVFLKGDPILPRESARYRWASNHTYCKFVLEIGCSTGYGTQFLGRDIDYTGLDYDPVIIEVAKEQNWDSTVFEPKFINADINTYAIGNYDVIIAFEIIEHLDNGLEIVEKLKSHCKRLLISVPWNEPVGFWGEHHKLHGLNESHFPDFQFSYIDQHGNISDTPAQINETNHCNLMLCRYDS